MQVTGTPCELVHKGVDSVVKFGMPIEKGRIWHVQNLELLLNESKLNCHVTPVGFWEDKSIRWVRVTTIAVDTGKLAIKFNNKKAINTSVPVKKEFLSSLGSNTLYKHESLPLSISVLVKLQGNSRPIELSNITNEVITTDLTKNYTVSGTFVFEKRILHLYCDIQECMLIGTIDVEVKLHNPTAAAHVGGKWDLGDKNSVVVEDFSIIFDSSNTRTLLVLDEPESKITEQTFDSNSFCLSQHGSGGEHWRSPIHWNQFKESTVQKQGFELKINGSEVISGLRANPTIFIDNESSFIQIVLDDFWQNFPVSLSSKDSINTWRLLANKTELQGGESKTWRLRCKSGKAEKASGNTNLLKKSLVPDVKFNIDYFNQCQVFPHIALSVNPSNLSKFINLSIGGEHSFFSKREKNDVYGWRHYGELDADHEAVNAPANTYFISHYNNQYDPLMGMTLQYLHTANPKWLALIHPLNQHIQDIDIYDTTEDKAEYNGGLMWHTDHYLSAETCTHRSNSKHHEAAYEGFLGGGGPGGQHCYTTGLALQYRLFCDESAKSKVIQLCNWIRCFYNGGGAITERTFRLLTIDIKHNTLTNIGIKAEGYKYPLDRGTGNYLTALLDCFDVTENVELLNEMGQLVRSTFHPNEDIELRDLKNIEKSWFYTVYLQAVVKYLLLKETRKSIDDDYWYARHALMHYGDWMLSNESYYLSNADQLEFPNDTWCAQDTRKMNLFCYFYYFSSTRTNAYLQKANEYYAYIVKHMENSNEAHFARILALLMQNDGVSQKFGLDNPKILAPRSPITYEEKDFNDAPTFSRYTILKTYLKDVTKLLLHFSPKSEWKWLSLRVKSVLNK